MIKKMGVVADFDRGISPYIKKNKKAYDLIKCQNSLGNEFLFVTDLDWLTKSRQKRLEKAIEEVKYPLTEMEQSTLLSHIEVVAAAKKRKSLTYEEFDKIFKMIGIYFRLGLLSLSFPERRSLITNYCFIYQLQAVASKFEYKDIEFICGLAAQGYTITEILKEYPDRDYQDIYRLLQKNGVSSISVKKRQLSWSDEDRDNLKTALEKGMNFSEIKEKLMPKRSEAAIRAYAYHLGLVKTKRG